MLTFYTPSTRIPAASMKVPPKRKGNVKVLRSLVAALERLNESPSEKEGK